MYELYNILNLNINCSKKDIRKSYLKLSKIYHPDKNNINISNNFIEISKAYHILYDDNKRNKYDLEQQNIYYKNVNDFASFLFIKSFDNFINNINNL